MQPFRYSPNSSTNFPGYCSHLHGLGYFWDSLWSNLGPGWSFLSKNKLQLYLDATHTKRIFQDSQVLFRGYEPQILSEQELVNRLGVFLWKSGGEKRRLERHPYARILRHVLGLVSCLSLRVYWKPVALVRRGWCWDGFGGFISYSLFWMRYPHNFQNHLHQPTSPPLLILPQKVVSPDYPILVN